MKIAVFHNLPSGGAKRSLYEWVKRLSERHRLDLYSYSNTEEEFLDVRGFMEDISVYGSGLPDSTGYSIYRKMLLFKELTAASKKMAEDIDKRDYDLVFANHCKFIQSPLVLKYLKTPSLYFCHEPFRRVYEPRPWKWKKGSIKELSKDALLRTTDIGLKRLDSANARAATYILANSNYTKGMIKKAYDIDAETNYLGVDVNTFTPDPEAQKGNEVISVGRLSPTKRHDFVIKSLGHVDIKIRPGLRIVCDGTNPDYRARLAALAEKLDVACSFITVPGEKMPEVYRSAVLTLFAPVREPLGLAAIESMACGVPVVGVKEAGICETVKDRETGLLTGVDPLEFARAITYLLTNKEIREEMGKRGVEYARKNWSWEKSTESLEKHMYNLIESVRTDRETEPLKAGVLTGHQ